MNGTCWFNTYYVNAHLPINGTCFTHTQDLLYEYIHLCKSTKSTRQAKHIVHQKHKTSKDKHNTTKYFILCQCTLTLIKVKTVIEHILWLHKIKVKTLTKYFMSHAYKIANIFFGTSCDFTHLPTKTQLLVH